MKKNRIFFALLGITAVTAGFLAPAPTSLANNANTPSLPAQALAHMPVCPPGNPAGIARCHAEVAVDYKGKPSITPNPVAYTPAQLHSAYNLPVNAPAGQIVAIVDAYDAPTIKADLDAYSNKFGLPLLPECSGPIASSAVPCFSKIDQSGGTKYPAVNPGWALEISLDVETVHAICQNCSILLIEANTSNFSDLMIAFDEAVAQGAKIISNSYGSREFTGETDFDSHFINKYGYAITFSSGDNGYGTSYPAASPYVTAVGGTTLYLNSSDNYSSETVWSGAGSGCSLIEAKPSYQKDASCAGRTIADVAAVADPNTGFSVYDSTPYNGVSGWFRVGGTSLSAPLIAAVYALAGGVPSDKMGNAAPYVLQNYSSNLHDITSGSNGSCSVKGKRTSSTTYFCTGISGYDGPSGLGTPNGIGAFGAF